MIAWIIGIVFLLIITLLISDKTVEPFDYNPPTVMPTKVRKDLTCSDPDSSSIIDRFDIANSSMKLIGSDVEVPPNAQNNALTDTTALGMSTVDLDGVREDLLEECEEGNLVFIRKDGTYPFRWRSVDYTFNYVDIYCCKGDVHQPYGTNGEEKKICLAACPSNYTISSSDNTICIRNDNNCIYTADLSGNIQNNWNKTCSALYKQNINITSTINSISNVVSTFTKQTDTVNDSYNLLNSRLIAYELANRGTSDSTKIIRRNNYINNFGIITTERDKINSIQTTIQNKYNTLKTDKVKFDTLFNKLGCSNFM